MVNNLIERDVLEHVLGRDVHSGVRAGNEIKVGCLQLEAHGVFVNLLGAGEILHCPTVFPQVLGPLDLRQPAALACDIPVGGCEPAPHDVVGSERPAIVPFDVLAQVEHPYPIRLLNVHLLGQLRCDLELFRLGRRAVAPLLTADKSLYHRREHSIVWGAPNLPGCEVREAQCPRRDRQGPAAHGTGGFHGFGLLGRFRGCALWGWDTRSSSNASCAQASRPQKCTSTHFFTGHSSPPDVDIQSCRQIGLNLRAGRVDGNVSKI